MPQMWHLLSYKWIDSILFQQTLQKYYRSLHPLIIYEPMARSSINVIPLIAWTFHAEPPLKLTNQISRSYPRIPFSREYIIGRWNLPKRNRMETGDRGTVLEGRERIRGSADHRRQLKVARLHAFPISTRYQQQRVARNPDFVLYLSAGVHRLQWPQPSVAYRIRGWESDSRAPMLLLPCHRGICILAYQEHRYWIR